MMTLKILAKCFRRFSSSVTKFYPCVLPHRNVIPHTHDTPPHHILGYQAQGLLYVSQRNQLSASIKCNGCSHHRSRVQTLDGTVLYTELPTYYHHISIIKLSVLWCVLKVGEGFPGRVLPKTLKWVALYHWVYSSVTFHISV